MLGGNLSALGVHDLMGWKMEEIIEAYQAESEGELEDLQYHDVFPEENPDDFETILDAVVEGMKQRGDDVDWELAIQEANYIYTERTGIVRGG